MWVSDSYEDIYARAESSLARGDYDTAQESFRRLGDRLEKVRPTVLERRPELHNLHLVSLARQAEIYRIQGEFEKAIQLYQRLIETGPESAERWRQDMALVKIDMGQAEAGLDELRAQAVAHPADHRLWLTIGLESEALGRWEEAEENLQRGARRVSEPNEITDAYLLLFDFYRARGRIEEALAAWDKAWESQAEGPDYIFPVYQMMWEAGDLERAHEYLSREKNPLRKGLHQGLLAQDQGKSDEAVKYWKRVARLDPTGYEEGQESWAEAALRVGHTPQDVISVLGTILDEGTFTPRGLILQAAAEARIGHTEHAESVLALARQVGLRGRPRREKLSSTDWALFDELVENDEIKEELRHFFEIDSDL
jgi:tetratricopeptide (TPR) repeat protein